jgi:DNA-directed RNA polymerase subunit N (RpoN/RPB10)
LTPQPSTIHPARSESLGLFSFSHCPVVVIGVVRVVADLLGRFDERLPRHHVPERFLGSQVIDELAVERFCRSAQCRELNRFLRLGTLELADPLLCDSQPSRKLELRHAE